MAKKNILKNHWLWMAVVALALIVYLTTSAESGPGEYDSLAQCLTEKGVIMHGTDWCPHCQNQKKAFGSSFQYINYVNCDKEPNTCILAKVEGYPTWTINGENYAGVQPLDKLAHLADCPLE